MSDDLLAPAVAATLAALSPRPEDAALVRMVQRYASVVDEATQIALLAAAMEPEDEGQAKALAALRQRVDAVTVLADIGPKLLAALESLGASPKARAALAARKGGDPGDGKAGGKLDEFRARRARQRGASDLDAPAS